MNDPRPDTADQRPVAGKEGATGTAGQDLSELYRRRFAGELERRRRIWEVLCRDFFDRFIAPDAVVLDLACGYGEFLNATRGARKIGVDLNPDARQYLQANIEFHNRSCADLEFLADESLDVVFESNFFEHLPSKEVLTSVVHSVRDKLKPGGRLIALQPNIRLVGGAYWDFYDHNIPMTERSCAELLAGCGLTVETVIPRFLPYTTKSRLPQSPFLVRLYLHVPLLWRILGGQFLIVARKPA